MTSEQLQKRIRSFAYRIVSLCEALSPKKISGVIEAQLLRSAFSAAANYRAACKGQSAKAFKSKLSIAFEEADESLFWIESIHDLNLLPAEKLTLLIKEADELVRILAATRISLEKKESLKNLKS